MSHPKQDVTPRSALMRNVDFRWLISGGAISMLGDQFTLIALPWLVLKMTGDSLILGIVLALIGVPRAVFILIGGALVDRYSPKQVMMLTKYINTLLLGALAALIFSNALQLWMVYIIALGLGLSTAFSIPSGTSMLPRVVPMAQLQAANSMMLGLRQLTMFAGPMLAGLLIAVFGDNGHGAIADARGLGAAFLFDCLSYAISAWTLHQVTMHAMPAHPQTQNADHRHILHSVAEGLRHCWNDKLLRTCFAYWSGIAFFIMGPIQIAMPLLAAKIGNSAGILGILAGAHGAGTLFGMLLSGMRPGLRFGSLGSTILLIDAIVGMLVMPLGMVHATWQAAAIFLLTGTLAGYLHVAVFTWIQKQVPPSMIGRAMSMFMFIFMGIGPVSAALTGWLMRSVSLAQLFVGCGCSLLLIVLIAMQASAMRQVSDKSVAG